MFFICAIEGEQDHLVKSQDENENQWNALSTLHLSNYKHQLQLYTTQLLNQWFTKHVMLPWCFYIKGNSFGLLKLIPQSQNIPMQVKLHTH